jgi:ectoine hydroxylase-related dioxygenase (phytanoyl-CoA dioxygenase family)
MDAPSTPRQRRDAVWLDAGSGDVAAFKALVATETRAADWPLAARIEAGIPVYDGATLRAAAPVQADRRDLMAEWATVFMDGPGIIAIKGAMADLSVVDRATALFEQIIAREKAEGAGGGDHFAKPGSNDRVWNAAEKHCRADPANFIAYFASDAIAMAGEAWLGTGYQVTAQVNRVNPGGQAQVPHRDYHLGFMTAESAAGWPAHVHRLSPALTLQGAVAHCDMPLESGPTLLLPYSQRFAEGYLAFGRPEFQAVFAAHHVQLPLEKGDAVFFNPAVMHGAGSNVSRDILRMANLLQISSAFGRAIESVDRAAMVTALYPHLRAGIAEGRLAGTALANVVAASAEGYPFPTNLDRDLPAGGLAPKSPAAILSDALAAGLDAETFAAAIAAHARRTRP